VASILREVFSNRNIITVSTTNMLFQIFNSLWEIWWSLYLMEELNVPVTMVGLLAAIQNTSQILFQLPGGIIADRIGRKKVIILGTGLRTLSPLTLYFARSWRLVAVGLLLNSMSSLYGPAFNAIISESLPKERRGSAFGAYRMFTSLPQIFMPVVSGYYFDMLGLGKAVRYGLLMFFGAMIVVTIVRYIVLKETLDTKKSDTSEPMFGKDTFKTFRNQPRIIYAMLAVAVISSFAMRMTWTYLTPYAIHVIGLSKTQYGMLQSIAMAISVPLYLISGMVADRFGRVPCILLARGLGPFDSLSLYLFHSYEKLVVAYGVIGFAGGLGGGRLRGGGYMGGPAWQALIADIVPSRDRAKIMGLMGTISGVIGLPGSYLGGYMYERNPDMLLLSGSILEALSIPLILFFVREPKRTAEPAD
jgi:MFS family permease